jgi:hypothetical protein
VDGASGLGIRGTLGGLVELGRPKRLNKLLEAAADSAAWCATAPVCCEDGPDLRGRGTSPGACHQCVLARDFLRGVYPRARPRRTYRSAPAVSCRVLPNQVARVNAGADQWKGLMQVSDRQLDRPEVRVASSRMHGESSVIDQSSVPAGPGAGVGAGCRTRW